MELADNEQALSHIKSMLNGWTDLKTDYMQTGFLQFTQQVPLADQLFTDKDVKKFKKKEKYRNVTSPDHLTTVSNGIRKSMIKKMKAEVKKLENFVKKYHGRVDLFDEGDKFTIQVDIGGMFKF